MWHIRSVIEWLKRISYSACKSFSCNKSKYAVLPNNTYKNLSWSKRTHTPTFLFHMKILSYWNSYFDVRTAPKTLRFRIKMTLLLTIQIDNLYKISWDYEEQEEKDREKKNLKGAIDQARSELTPIGAWLGRSSCWRLGLGGLCAPCRSLWGTQRPPPEPPWL